MDLRYLLRAEGKTIQAMWVAMGSLSFHSLEIVFFLVLLKGLMKSFCIL